MKTKRRQQFESSAASSSGPAVTSASASNPQSSGAATGGGGSNSSATGSGSGSGSSGGITTSTQGTQMTASGGGGGGLLAVAPVATPSLSAPVSTTMAPLASGEVQRSMRELSKQIHVVKDRMDSMVHTLENIERAKQRLNSNDNQGRAGSPVTSSSSGYARSRLRSLLATALNEAKNEASVLQAAIVLCNQIVRETVPPAPTIGGLVTPAASGTSVASSSTPSIGPLSLTLGTGQPPLRRGVLMALLMRQAESLPIWVPPINDPDEEPAPLCGATPIETYYMAKAGDMVAAKVRSDDTDDADENWILSEVVTFNQATSKYEVVDIDAEEGKQIHILSRRRVIPLPLWRANPRTHPDALFQPGTVVLALYPQTTCFYKGVVDRPPRRCRDPYQILFEDTCYPDGYSPPLPVAQRYVICFKEEKNKVSATKLT